MPQNVSLPPRPPKRYWDDSKWARQNVQALSKNYPNEWVAIFQKGVVAHNTDLKAVMDMVETQAAIASPVIKFIEKGIHIYKYFVSDPDEL